jgi:hypothetical protein
MAAWHRSRRADLGLRASGAFFCWLACTALAHLVAMHAPPRSPGLIPCGLAAIGFLSASGGSLLLVLGRNIFDEVTLGARWRREPP